MRLIVCGSREWTDYDCIERELAAIKENIELVIEGESRGADRLARKACEKLGIPVLPMPADWLKYGKSAGPIRNQQMLKVLLASSNVPVGVLAFHKNLHAAKVRGHSGTADMVEIATESGVEVKIVDGTKAKV